MARKKKSTTSGKRKGRQSGRGVKDIAKKILKEVKDNRLISRGLALTPYKGAATVASLVGLGRKRKKRKMTSGKRVRVVMPSVLAPRVKRVSRRRGIAVPRRAPGQLGAGFFSDLGGGIGSVFGGLGSGVGSVARGLFGSGRKRRGKGVILI
jgi:hypothetical protein